MICNKIQKLLNNYIDKEIKEKATITFVENHLDNCPACRAEMNDLLSMKQFFAQKEQLTADAGFVSRCKERIEQQQRQSNFGWINEVGDWAKKLIPIPISLFVVAVVLMFNISNESHKSESTIYDHYLSEKAVSSINDNDESLIILEKMYLSRGDAKK